jgi:hypothetical protein
MPRRRAIKGALAGFLGTFTSRNLDYKGYWLMGMVAINLWDWNIDLLGVAPVEDTPEAAFRRSAIHLFAEQVSKSRIPISAFATAEIETAAQLEIARGLVGANMAEGHIVTFIASATMNTNRSYKCERAIFVAPHNPEWERRRRVEDWGLRSY